MRGRPLKKIIEVKRSKFDAAKSNPEKGQYTWIQKTYMNEKLFDAEKKWKFTWRKNRPSNIAMDRSVNGYEPVKINEPYVPEAAVANSDGNWEFGDLILSKINLLRYLQQREEDIKLSDARAKFMSKGFQDDMSAQGAGVSQEFIDQAVASMLGQEVDPVELKKKTSRDMKSVFGY
jgi:hypothetical protein